MSLFLVGRGVPVGVARTRVIAIETGQHHLEQVQPLQPLHPEGAPLRGFHGQRQWGLMLRQHSGNNLNY